MNISSKLLLIVMLTAAEVSITIFSALEIAKGAKFHQLNFLHLKYVNQLDLSLNKIKNGEPISIDVLKADILAVRQQPIECLEQVNTLNKVVMNFIKTSVALQICEKDIRDANSVLTLLTQFENGMYYREQLLADLNDALYEFKDNSEKFEGPITKTVSFILKSLIPLVLINSLFNVVFISYI